MFVELMPEKSGILSGFLRSVLVFESVLLLVLKQKSFVEGCVNV